MEKNIFCFAFIILLWVVRFHRGWISINVEFRFRFHRPDSSCRNIANGQPCKYTWASKYCLLNSISRALNHDTIYCNSFYFRINFCGFFSITKCVHPYCLRIRKFSECQKNCELLDMIQKQEVHASVYHTVRIWFSSDIFHSIKRTNKNSTQ